ncbi:MAG: VOC family protein [Gemmatimonadales bacterium]|nr:VOC family protein [Gemmatimonadales bacterium]
MSHTVVHFEIPADQPERAAEFYRELFGWKIEHMGGPMDYWLVNTVPTDAEGRPIEPGVNGGLMRRMMPEQTPVNYISVENVDQFARKAESLGAKVVAPKTPVPGMGWFAQLTDTEGNIFAIWQHDPAAAVAEPAGQHA